MMADGRILVTGGTDELNRRLKTSEIYDPLTGVWSPVASMTEVRPFHTQTTLPSGMVLVTGGSGANGHLSSCELYDPVKNEWEKTDSMFAPRFWHQATLLKSGKVLVTGNHYDAEVYSPTSKSWRYTWEGVEEYRFNHTSTLLGDGRVLIAGGSQGIDAGLVARAEIYDPARDVAKPEIEIRSPKKQKLVSGKGTVSLGSVKAGASGKPKVFKIENLGNLPLTGIGITLRGADKKSFALGDFSKTSIDPYETTTLKIKFRPTRKGNLNAELRIRSNDANESPFIVRLTGVAQ